MPLNLFLSYRRPRQEGERTVASDLAGSLEASWAPRGRVIFDRTAVTELKRFATDLVDEGLNQCDGTVALIDEHWLAAARLGRLGHEDDWVRFELSYSLEHRLFLLLVGTPDQRQQLKALPLSGTLVQLRQALWFEWHDDGHIEVQTRRMAAFLERHLPGHRRLPSQLHADASHNLAKRLSVDEAEAHLAPLPVAYQMLALADEFRLVVRLIGAGLLLAGLVSGAGNQVAMVALALLLGGLGFIAPRWRTMYLERLNTHRQRQRAGRA